MVKRTNYQKMIGKRKIQLGLREEQNQPLVLI
jgi:hypothetical protein